MTHRDFEEFFACFNAHRVRYLVVGAYAVGFHGYPRATKDIDVLVDPTVNNAKRVLAALKQFLGVVPPNFNEQKLVNPRTLLVLGIPPIRIDILTSIAGVNSFARAWDRRARGRYGSVGVGFISVGDLRKAKKASGRPQDLLDLENLSAVNRKRQGRGS